MHIAPDNSRPEKDGEIRYFMRGLESSTLQELHIQMLGAIRAMVFARQGDSTLDQLYSNMWKLQDVVNYLAGTSKELGEQCVRFAFISALRQYTDHRAFLDARKEAGK